MCSQVIVHPAQSAAADYCSMYRSRYPSFPLDLLHTKDKSSPNGGEFNLSTIAWMSDIYIATDGGAPTAGGISGSVI